MNEKEDISAILEAKRIAIIGLSRDQKSYSRLVMNELRKRGHEVVGVNKNSDAIGGVRCFAGVESVSPPADAAIVILPPEKSDTLVQECLDAKITRIWVRGREGRRSVSETLANSCNARGVRLVDGFCPLMFLERMGFPHNFHGTVARWMKLVPEK